MNGHHHSYVQAAIDGEVSRLACAASGERNDVLFKATASLASLGIREGEILRYLKPTAETIGLRGSEIYSTVKSGVKAGRENPRNVPGPIKNGPKGVGPLPDGSIELPSRSTTAQGERPPAFCIGTENGPSASSDEVRRHPYRRNGNIVRVKIKRRGGGYVNWYRVTGGWQAGKPEGYEPCPYTGEFDAFNSEFRTEALYWPEGEKDCDALSREGLPAFTFGGTGDGLPPGISRYLEGRDIVILADNDVGGQKHAVKKAEIAHSIANSVKVVEFPELPPKNDVSDFLQIASPIDLERRASDAPLWTPDTIRAEGGWRASVITGAADTILVLRRQAGSVTLHARGRDIEEKETACRFDKITCRWTLLGDAIEVHGSGGRAATLPYVVRLSDPPTPHERLQLSACQILRHPIAIVPVACANMEEWLDRYSGLARR